MDTLIIAEWAERLRMPAIRSNVSTQCALYGRGCVPAPFPRPAAISLAQGTSTSVAFLPPSSNSPDSPDSPDLSGLSRLLFVFPHDADDHSLNADAAGRLDDNGSVPGVCRL
jgi:hypothetical protein